ncbi:YcaO-like family protein [Bdellovibrionota bacterium FG-2]
MPYSKLSLHLQKKWSASHGCAADAVRRKITRLHVLDGWPITNIFCSLLGVTNRDLNEAIQEEQAQGAVFERLLFPVASLKDFHLIQFFKPTENGRAIAGLGADWDEKRAYRKAVISAGIELGFNSTNGVGAHRYPALAFRAGTNELFERDSFLRHWYSKTPFFKLDESLISSTQAWIGDLKSLGYRSLVCKTYLGFISTTLAFLIDEKTGGFALGLSNGRGGKEDTQKAFIEAVINLFFGNEGKPTEELLSRVKKHGVRSLIDHRTNWLLINSVPAWILTPVGSMDQQIKVAKLKVPKVERVTLAVRPVPVVGAHCEESLNLVLGLPNERDLEILRRSQLFPVNGGFVPHPIP